MTAIVMGDDNAVYTLECVNRRQLLGARAQNERSLLITGLPFLRTKTIDIYIDDLVILSILHFSDVHVDSSPIEVQRADALYDFLQMPHTRASQAVRSRESFGEDAWMASHERSDSLLNAEFRSCSSRCSSLLSV